MEFLHICHVQPIFSNFTLLRFSRFASNFFHSTDQFTDDDVIVATGTLTAVGNNRSLEIDVVVTEPGNDVPVAGNFVQDALIQTLREDNQTTIRKLQIAVTNAPTISAAQVDNAISIRLEGIQSNEVSFEYTFIRFLNTRKFPVVLFNILHYAMIELKYFSKFLQILPRSFYVTFHNSRERKFQSTRELVRKTVQEKSATKPAGLFSPAMELI